MGGVALPPREGFLSVKLIGSFAAAQRNSGRPLWGLFEVGEGSVLAEIIVGGGQRDEGAVDGVAVLIDQVPELAEGVGVGPILELGADMASRVVDERVPIVAVDMVKVFGVEVRAADKAVQGLGGTRGSGAS